MRLPFLGSFDRKIGIDLGSDRIRIWSDEDGYVVDEPACIAIDQSNRRVLAVGQDALEMVGRVRKDIVISRPIQAGIMTDPDTVVALLKVLLRRVYKAGYFIKPVLMVSLPAATTSVDQIATTEMLYNLGANEVVVISQPLAAAIGAGIPIAETAGSCLIHLGDSLIESAVISLSSIVKSSQSKQAGFYCDQLIVNDLQSRLALKISLEQARQLKHKLGNLYPADQELMISGKNLTTGAPQEVMIMSQSLQPVFMSLAERYLLLMKELLEEIPAELVTDIIDRGILLTGGFSQVNGLDEYLVKELGVAVAVVDEPEIAVIKGIATVLEHLDLFKESIGYQN